MEIGFGGFAGIVDAVGGVDMCVDAADQGPAGGHRPARRAARSWTARRRSVSCGPARSRPLTCSACRTSGSSSRRCPTRSKSPSDAGQPVPGVPADVRGNRLGLGRHRTTTCTTWLDRAQHGRRRRDGDRAGRQHPDGAGCGSVVQWNKEKASTAVRRAGQGPAGSGRPAHSGELGSSALAPKGSKSGTSGPDSDQPSRGWTAPAWAVNAGEGDGADVARRFPTGSWNFSAGSGNSPSARSGRRTSGPTSLGRRRRRSIWTSSRRSARSPSRTWRSSSADNEPR